jgi:hypothetical protein
MEKHEIINSQTTLKKRHAKACLFLFDQVSFKYDYLNMYQSSVLYNKTQVHSDFLESDIWNLLDKTYQIPKTFDFNIFEIRDEKYIARPDIVSMDMYGDPVFADIICKLNGISNPFELNVGMTIILPSPSDIFTFTQQAPRDELEGKTNDEIPVPKRKNQKRQANEAIVGDKRFKIDAAKGIVIY